MTSIEIPNSVTIIEDDAFRDCSSLANIIVPSTVTSIEDKAFINFTGNFICKRNSEAHRFVENAKRGYYLMKNADLNENNKVDTGDVLILLRHIAQSGSERIMQAHPQWKLSDKDTEYGDTNKNGSIETGDVLKVQRYIAAKASKVIAQKHPEWLKIE